MEKRLRNASENGGRGYAMRNSAMERLVRYSTQPTLQRDAVQQKEARTNPTQMSCIINVPSARMTSEYKQVKECGGEGRVRRNIMTLKSFLPPGLKEKQETHGDNNNNSTAVPSNQSLLNGQRKKSKDERLAEMFSARQTDNNKKKYESLKEKTDRCICNRPKTHVLCTICGYSSFGRVRTPCNAHLRVTYLLEMASCPRCNSGRLMEIAPLVPTK